MYTQYERAYSSKNSFFETNASSRKGTDKVAVLQRDLANQKYFSYTTRPMDYSTGADTKNFAANHRIMFQGTKGGGISGDTIKAESRLIFPRMSDHFVNNRLDPVHRPFATVPYLGQGRRNVTREFELLKGMRNPTDDELVMMKNNSILSASSHSFRPEGAPYKEMPNMPQEWVRGGEVTAKRAPYTK
jgi:hypothetical protein